MVAHCSAEPQMGVTLERCNTTHFGDFPFNRLSFQHNLNLIVLTIVNSGNILSHTIDGFVTRSIPVQDGGKGLLVNITD